MYLNVEQSFCGTDQGRPMPNILGRNRQPAAANIWVIYVQDLLFCHHTVLIRCYLLGQGGL